MKVLFVNADDTSRHVSSANTAIYPNLGLLTLMSALTIKIGRDKVGYIDGTVFGNDAIHKYINDYSDELSVSNLLGRFDQKLSKTLPLENAII